MTATKKKDAKPAKTSHGGARAGAGRKPSERGPVVTTSVSVTQGFLDDLDAYTATNGLPSRSATLELVGRQGLAMTPKKRGKGDAGSRAAASVCVPHLTNALKLVEREMRDGHLVYTISAEGPALMVIRKSGQCHQVPGVMRLNGLDHYAQAIRDYLVEAGVMRAAG
jgi:hypothetical protein